MQNIQELVCIILENMTFVLEKNVFFMLKNFSQMHLVNKLIDSTNSFFLIDVLNV